jgi:hypothetical protein
MDGREVSSAFAWRESFQEHILLVGFELTRAVWSHGMLNIT